MPFISICHFSRPQVLQRPAHVRPCTVNAPAGGQRGSGQQKQIPCTESVPERKATVRIVLPVSVVNPGKKYLIADEGDRTVFSVIIRLPFGRLLRMFMYRQIDGLLAKLDALLNRKIQRIAETEGR